MSQGTVVWKIANVKLSNIPWAFYSNIFWRREFEFLKSMKVQNIRECTEYSRMYANVRNIRECTHCTQKFQILRMYSITLLWMAVFSKSIRSKWPNKGTKWPKAAPDLKDIYKLHCLYDLYKQTVVPKGKANTTSLFKL